MGSDVKNMSQEWDVRREGGKTVFVCVIIKSIFHF